MNKKAVINTLRRAADHIDEVGFHKGGWWKGFHPNNWAEDELVKIAKGSAKDLPCCAWGAIYFAAPSLNTANDAGNQVGMHIPDRYGEDVAEWNDITSRRKGDVTSKLREVADKLEKGVA